MAGTLTTLKAGERPTGGGPGSPPSSPPPGDPRPPRRRRRRLLLWAALAVVLLPLALVGLLLGALQTQPGRDLLRDAVVALASGPDLRLDIGRIEGAPPGRIVVEQLEVADSEGVWLSGERLTLDWSPLALLGGTLDVTLLAAERLEVARAPAGGPEPASENDGGFQLPTLPVEVRLERLALDRLTLGAPLLGEALDLEVVASLAAEREGRVESTLEITETGGEGVVDAEAVYRLDDRHLSASLRAEAPAGGRFSRLSGLPGAPDLAFTLDGQGPLPGWQADWRLQAAPVATAEGRLGLDSLEPVALALSGRLEPGRAFPAEAAPWVRPALAFDLTARYDGAVQTARLTVRELGSGALAASGEADADLGADTAEARLSLRLTDPAPLGALVPALSLAGLRIEATAGKDGQTATLALNGEIERPRIATGPEAAIGFERVTLSLDSGEVDLEAPLSGGTAARLEVTARGPQGDPALASLLAPTTTLAAEVRPQGDALELAALDLSSGPLSLSADGRYVLEGAQAGGGRLEATLRQDELSRLSDLAGLSLSGRLSVTLDGRLAADGGGRVRLAAEPQELSLGIPAAQALLGPRPLLELEAERAPDGRIRLAEAALSGTPVETGSAEGPVAPLRLNAQGGLDPAAGELDLTASLALPHLAALQQAGLPLSGEATLDLTAFGALEAPQAVWALRSPALTYQGRTIEALEIDGTTLDLPDSPSGHVELRAGLPVGPLAGGFDYALAGQTARVEKLALTRGDDRLAGTVTADLAAGTADGRLSLAVSDLGAYEALTGSALAGALDAEVSLAGAEGTQTASVTAEARELAVAELTLGSLSLQAEGRDLTGTPRLNADLSARALATAEASLSEIEVSLDGSLSQLALKASLDGEALGRPLALSTAAELALDERTRIRLTRLEANLAEERLSLAGPATLSLDGNRTRVEALALTVAGGRLNLDADLRPGAVEAGLEIDDLPLRLIELAAPNLNAEGSLDARLQLSGTPPRPDGSLTVAAEGIRIGRLEDVAALPALALGLDGRLGGGRLSLDGRVSGFAERPLSLTGELPLLVTATPPSVNLPDDEPLSLDADWEGELGELMTMLPIDAVRFGGDGRIDLALRGTLAEPDAAGSVSVEDGFYENYTLGMRLDPVTLDLSGRGRRLELERFDSRDEAGGTMHAEGFIDLSGGTPRFDLTFKADNAHVAQRDDVSGAVDADFALSGTTEGANLKGTLRTRPTEIRLIDALPPSVTELEVVEVNDAEAARAAREEAEEEEATPGIQGLRWLSLGVAIEVPGQVFVRGRGLDSEWSGSLQVGGTAEQPRISGQLGPVRGVFEFAGRVFNLDPGSSIQFLGSATIDPELDLVATYDGDEFTASIEIFGPVSDPQFQLTSSPPLPEDEILARVLFGKSSGQLSTAEAVQLAQAAATLEGGGDGLMDIARQTLGVDVLTFAPGETSEDLGSLKIGKYVADDVFVGAEQGTTAGSSTAIVEWELTPNITVESEVGADSRSNASINWKWDY